MRWSRTATAERAKTYLLVLLMAVSFSSASILVLLSGLPGPSAATWRLLLSAAITWAFALSDGRKLGRSLSDRATLGLAIASGALVAAHFDLWMTSLYLMPVGVSVAIVDSYPAFIWALGAALFGERYAAAEVVGALLTTAGVVSLALTELDPPGGLKGVALSLGGMAAMVGYVLLGKLIRSRWSTSAYTAVAYSSGALVNLLALTTTRALLMPASLTAWDFTIALAIVPMIGGHTTMNYLLGRNKVLAATVAMAAEPAGASVLAYLVFGQGLTLPQVALIAMISLGVVLSSRP